nr:12002_t:CDS:2 [Entrophospora candida]
MSRQILKEESINGFNINWLGYHFQSQSDQSTNISTPVFTDGQAPTGVEFPDSYKDDQHKESMMNIKGKKKGDVGKNDNDSNLIYSEPNLQSTG